MAGRSANCALAYVREHTDGRLSLIFLQCMRMQFDGEGRAYTWNMSVQRLQRECLLRPGAKPVGKYTKFRQEPHYWFPTEQEMEQMVQALTPRRSSGLKAQLLHATMRPSRPAPAPFMVPPSPHGERRAEQQ